MSEDPSVRILVGLDGSEGSAAALERAISLARSTGAEIVAVHVFDLPYPSYAPMTGGAAMGMAGEVRTLEESMRERVKEAFRTEWSAPLQEAGVRYREVFGEGRPGPVLAEAAEREDVDLIVVGRRGRGSLTELIAGSVSQYLIHRANRPVLVVPDPKKGRESIPSEKQTPTTIA